MRTLAATLALLTLVPAAAHAAPGDAAATTGSVAVVDLSPAPQAVLAEALRKTPRLKGRAQPAATTAAIVADAKGLGLACTVADAPCLEKLLVLLRTESVIAFSLERSTVKLAWLEVNGVDAPSLTRAKVKLVAPATTARAALDALDEALIARKVRPAEARVAAPPEQPAVVDETPSVVATGRAAEPAEPQTLVQEARGDGGFSPPLAIAIGGGVLFVGCGAGALGVSADLANQLITARDGGGIPDPAAFQQGELVFGALGVCSLAGLATGVVGTVLFFAEPAEDAPGAALSGR